VQDEFIGFGGEEEIGFDYTLKRAASLVVMDHEPSFLMDRLTNRLLHRCSPPFFLPCISPVCVLAAEVTVDVSMPYSPSNPAPHTAETAR
jgi:hypothetical protein